MKTEKEILERVEDIDEVQKLIRVLGSTVQSLDAFKLALLWVLEAPDSPEN